jgi:hypothetical protein
LADQLGAELKGFQPFIDELFGGSSINESGGVKNDTYSSSPVQGESKQS